MAQTKQQISNSVAQKKRVAAGNEIGELPPVVNPQRRNDCGESFRLFCETYFPFRFFNAWSDSHLSVISKIETVTTEGGSFAVGMPRASGKSTLAECGTLWALLYGYRSYIAVIGAKKENAEDILDSIQNELFSNDLLLEDFPEVCHPIRLINQNVKRGKHQTYKGENTYIVWTKSALKLPTIEGSVSSGALVRVCGMTSAIRGLRRNIEGRIERPDLIFLDDPQTSESAQSVMQTVKRWKMIHSDIKNLVGQNEKLACLCTLTVIEKDDLAERLLDHEQSPDWQGEKHKLMASMPENEELWEQYKKIRAESILAGEGIRRATKFYDTNRQAMDAGAIPCQPDRYVKVEGDYQELSAIQNAMNLLYENGAVAFAAEFQNEPLTFDPEADLVLPTLKELTEQQNQLARYQIPDDATQLVSFIDVQGVGLLFYMVVAFNADGMTGRIVDYGTYPEQSTTYFTKRQLSMTLEGVTHAKTESGQIIRGLETLTNQIISRTWKRTTKGSLPISRILIDEGYKAETVRKFISESQHKGLLMASKGIGVGVDNLPFSEHTPKPGEEYGYAWKTYANRTVPTIHADINLWKVHIAEALRLDPEDKGSLSLWRDKPERHLLFGEHILAEYPMLKENKKYGRSCYEWFSKPGDPDNDLLDCVVGCCVAASERGCKAVGHDPIEKPKRKKKPRRKLNISW